MRRVLRTLGFLLALGVIALGFTIAATRGVTCG